MLRFLSLAAATPLTLPRHRPPRAKAFAAARSRAVPINLELVTLTDTSAVLTWFTADPARLDDYGRPAPLPADTVVELGTTPERLVTVVERDDETPYHYVELTGLEPGRTYWYRCMSNGLVAVPTQVPGTLTSTGRFTTPLPPPGRHLLTMAWANDTHIGEMVSGLAISNPSLPGGGFPPGFAADPTNPYWKVMAIAAVDEARERGADLLLVAGDLTSEAEPANMAMARSILDRFGTYRHDYWVVRGNHDRPHAGPTWASCRRSPTPEYGDCLLDEFFPDGRTWFSFDHRGLHVVGLDTNDLRGQGAISPEQFEWLEADLAASSGKPTFVFGHHPVSEESSVTAVPPVVFTVNRADAQRLEKLVASHSVVGVYTGHTHRNKRTSSPDAPGVPFIELGAVKEYPGGYGIVRIHEGGYAVNFYKTRADPARAWSERSRGEYLNLYPYYTLGNLEDRNFVVEADFSDVARALATSPGRAHSARVAAEELPATGGDATPLAVGTGLAGAGLAAAALARRARPARDGKVPEPAGVPGDRLADQG